MIGSVTARSYAGGLDMWVIYRKPSDYPRHFVARLFSGDHPTLAFVLSLDLEELRIELQRAGWTCLARQPTDDPVIVETWL